MRYLPEKTNVYFYHDDLDAEKAGTILANVRFASYDSTILPEVGEVIRGPFGYYGAEVEAEVTAVNKGGEPLGICYDVHLKQIADGKCLYCRSETQEHNKMEGKYLCPADKRVHEAAIAKFGS